MPFFFSSKKEKKEKIENILFSFSFSCLFKERKKEKRKKNKTRPLFPLLLQAFFFFANKDVREKIWHVKREGEDQKEKKKKEMRDMIATRKAGLVLFLMVPLRAVGKLTNTRHAFPVYNGRR